MGANGRLHASELARIYHPSLILYLRKDAAASWNTMRLHALHVSGVDLYPEGALGAYRSLAGQIAVRREWCARGQCGNAAIPGTSNHGRGLAVDLLDAGMWNWIDKHGSHFGWHHYDAAWEAWHREYDGGFHRPNPGISRAYPVLCLGSGGPGQAPHVLELQRLLNRHHRRVHETGEFTAGTRHQLNVFQHSRGMHATGITDPTTWRHLRR